MASPFVRVKDLPSLLHPLTNCPPAPLPPVHRAQLWSAGCIFAEMITGKPLFTGESEIDQLFKTFRALGTPTPAAAPTLCSLPAFQSTFPKWRGEPLRQLLRGATRGGQSGLCPKEEELALSLLAVRPLCRLPRSARHAREAGRARTPQPRARRARAERQGAVLSLPQ